MMCREAPTDIKIKYTVTGGHELCKKTKKKTESWKNVKADGTNAKT